MGESNINYQLRSWVYSGTLSIFGFMFIVALLVSLVIRLDIKKLKEENALRSMAS